MRITRAASQTRQYSIGTSTRAADRCSRNDGCRTQVSAMVSVDPPRLRMKASQSNAGQSVCSSSRVSRL